VESFNEPQVRFQLVQLILKPVKLNSILVLVHAMKAYRGTGGIAALIPNLGISWI
jgi:hypothetical protein